MNYQRIYDSIIHRAVREELSNIRKKGNGNYYERHHIVPKCMGGSNDTDNLVLLTGREHFICHLLLCRIYEHTPFYHKLLYAVWNFCSMPVQNSNTDRTIRHVISARTYQHIRENLTISVETKQKISKKLKGIPKPKNFGEQISMAKKGVPLSDAHKENLKRAWESRPAMSIETRKKIGVASKGRPGPWTGKQLSDDHKNKIKLSLTGKRHSEETKQKLRGAKRSTLKYSYPKAKIMCPVCSKIGGVGKGMKLHIDKCTIFKTKNRGL